MALAFDLSDDLKQIAALFEQTLSPKEIKKSLANALNAAQTESKKSMVAFAKTSYNFDKKLFLKDYKLIRANSTKRLVSEAIYKSGPTSLRLFAQAKTKEGIGVYVKKQSIVKSGFLITSGIFVREGDKVAPTKGIYKGRKATRGPRKGQQILRQRIDKKYTLSSADVAKGIYTEANKNIDLAKLFETKLNDMLTKKQNATP